MKNREVDRKSFFLFTFIGLLIASLASIFTNASINNNEKSKFKETAQEIYQMTDVMAFSDLLNIYGDKYQIALLDVNFSIIDGNITTAFSGTEVYFARLGTTKETIINFNRSLEISFRSNNQYLYIKDIVPCFYPPVISLWIVLVVGDIGLGFLLLLISNRQQKKILSPIIDGINDLAHKANMPGNNDPLLTIADLNIATENRELALHSEQDKVELILNSMSQGIIVLNSGATVVMINKSAAHVFHCKEEEAIGRHLSFLFASYKITNAVENALKNAQSSILRLPIDSRIYLTAITPIQSNEATIVPIRDGAVITLLDISESANAENMKQLFFTNASHELKSPLTTIIGYQQMLIEGMLTSKEEKQDALSRSLREALRMKTIITEMLELAQIESQSEIVDAKSIDLDRVITDLLSSMEKDIKDRDIKVTTDLKNLLVYMKAEHAQELVHNLIENAVKYNRPHGHIYIATDGENRTLIVQDNGIGIAKEHQARVFERFYRVDKGRSKEEGGTGLGLAIVKHVAMLYGAKITLKSEESVGSTFIITFK